MAHERRTSRESLRCGQWTGVNEPSYTNCMIVDIGPVDAVSRPGVLGALDDALAALTEGNVEAAGCHTFYAAAACPRERSPH